MSLKENRLFRLAKVDIIRGKLSGGKKWGGKRCTSNRLERAVKPCKCEFHFQQDYELIHTYKSTNSCLMNSYCQG